MREGKNAFSKECVHAFVCHELTKLSMLFLPQQTKRLLLVINMKFTTASHLYRKIAGDVEFMPHYSMRLIFELANRGNKNATFINFYHNIVSFVRQFARLSCLSIISTPIQFHANGPTLRIVLRFWVCAQSTSGRTSWLRTRYHFWSASEIGHRGTLALKMSTKIRGVCFCLERCWAFSRRHDHSQRGEFLSAAKQCERWRNARWIFL